MVFAFIGSALGTLTPVGVYYAHKALSQGATAQDLIVLVYLSGINSVYSLSLIARNGMVGSRSRRSGRRVFKPRYPRAAYLPWGGGLGRRYLLVGIAGLAVGAAFQFPVAVLEEKGLPIGIVTVLGWASNTWLAIAEFPLSRRNFRWGKLILPVVGLIQLAGVSFAVGLLQPNRAHLLQVDMRLLGDPVIIAMLVASMFSAWMGRYMEPLRARELSHFHPEVREAHEKDLDHQVLGAEEQEALKRARDVTAGKVLAYPSLFKFGCFAVILFVAIPLGSALPSVKSPGYLAWSVCVLSLGAFGNRIFLRKQVDGNAAYNGAAAFGTLGLSFYWSWQIQGVAFTSAMFGGAVVALTGAIFIALLSHRSDDPLP